MKKLLVVIAVTTVFASCGGNTGTESPTDSQSVRIDTLGTGSTNIMTTDTAGSSEMNADTNGMSNAR